MANNIIYRITSSSTNSAESIKGSGLTSTEVDANFKGLSNEIVLRAPIASPTFTGSVVIPAGTINNASVGATTRSTGAFTSLTANGATTLTAGTASTNTTTGTVVVTGGVGISGAVFIGSTLNITGATTIASGTINNASVGATTRSTGAFTTLAANAAVTLTAGTASTNTTTGTVVVTGGVGISGALNIGGAISAASGALDGVSIGLTTRSTGAFTSLTANAAVTLTANTPSTNTTTGTVVVTGGVGISGALNVGGQGDFSTHTGALKIPVGTTGQQPGSPSNGMFRYNSTLSVFEGYAGGAWTVLGSGTVYLTYENRNTIRTLSPQPNDIAIIDGVGLFVWISGSTVSDDDETTFATASGRWILQSPSLEYVTGQIETLVEKQVIYGEFWNTTITMAGSTQIIYNINCLGAKIGDVVVISPPSTLPIQINIHGYVSQTNLVTIVISNNSVTGPTLPTTNFWTFAVLTGA